MKKFVLILLALSLMLSTAACGKKDDKEAGAGDAIKIGIFEPLTGNSSSGGLETVAGVELAHEQKGSVLGRPIELVRGDTQSDPLVAGHVADDLIGKNKITAAIGTCASYLAVAGGPKFMAGKVPIVAPGATSPAVTKNNPYYFRVCFTDPDQGKVMAKYAAENLNAKTAVVVKNMGSDYSISLCQAFKQSFNEINGPTSVVYEDSYISGDEDFSSQVQHILDKDPDVVFAAGEYKECAGLVKAARDKGYQKPFLGGDTWDIGGFISGIGSSSQIYFTAHYNADNVKDPAAKAFVDLCKSKNVTPSSLTALGYDAYMLILDAIEKTGKADPEAIRDTLAQTKGFQGVAGEISLNENGDPIKPVVIDSIENGQVKFVTTIQ
mgnify:CR=1 FL=1